MAILLQCIADTYLEQDYPDLNNGSATSLGCRNWAGYNWYSEILMKFQQLTPGTYSKIYLYVKQRNRDNFYNILNWKKMNAAWNEATATYGNTNRNYTSISVSQVIRDGEWVTYDLTPHYSYLASSNNGFAITPGTDTDVWIDSRESDNPPYIVAYTANDIMPPYNLQPVTDQIGQVAFGWDSDSSYTSYEIQYKQGDNDWTTITKKTLNSAELTDGTVVWRVRINNNGAWSEWSVPVEFDFTRVYLQAPTNLQPTSNQRGNVTISWDNVQGDNPSTQTEYEIQYSYNQLDWQTISGTGTSTQHTIPAGTFQFDSDSVTIYYRVRVKNNFGVWSNWSETSSFLYYSSNPKKPTNLTLTQNAGDVILNWTYNANDTEEQSGADVEYSFDNQNWSTLSHSGSTTAYTIAESYLNSTAVTQRTVYVRIRTKNALGGVSVYSDTKQINYKTSKPVAPGDLQPFGQQLQGTIKATWQFINTGRGDTQKAFELMYKCEGQNWVTVSGTTASEYTFENLIAGIVLWKVRVQSTLNVWSDWSVEASFTYAAPPGTPVVTTTGVIDIPKPIISWAGEGQTAFQLQILKDDTIYFDSADTPTSEKQYLLPKALENNTTYIIKLRIKNVFNLWSEWATSEISTVFAEPNKPSFYIFSNNVRGSIVIQINNPAGEAVKNEILKKQWNENETEWLRVAADIEENGQFIDYTCISGIQYEYKIRAINLETTGYKDSDVQNCKTEVQNTQIALVSDFSKWVELIWQEEKKRTLKIKRTLTQYVGRQYPVAIFGEEIEDAWKMRFSVYDIDTIKQLEDFLLQKEILLFRDWLGRKEYVTFAQLDYSEKLEDMSFEVDITFDRINYLEGV